MYKRQYVTHVGIYVGNNQMYHAGDPIGYADLSNSYWQQHLIGAGPVSYTHLDVYKRQVKGAWLPTV